MLEPRGQPYVKYGYRFGEVPLAEVLPPKDGVRVNCRASEAPLARSIVETSLGPIVLGAANPHGDPNHVPNIVRSVYKRVGCVPPTPNRKMRREFAGFVREWLFENVVPLDPGYVFDVAEWIRCSPYSAARKKQLFDLHSIIQSVDLRYSHHDTAVKCFVKDESYPGYKHVRGIYARVDEFKIRVGPFFSALERVVYECPQFVKHIPVSGRAKYVYDRLHRGGASYIATDYTAFESHFTRELFEECEFQLYRHFARDHSDARLVVEYFCAVVGGTNRCEFKHVRARIPACRMSGEMCTSVGNGFTNLMVFLFLKRKFGADDAECVVEGDDCLARLNEQHIGWCAPCGKCNQSIRGRRCYVDRAGVEESVRECQGYRKWSCDGCGTAVECHSKQYPMVRGGGCRQCRSVVEAVCGIWGRNHRGHRAHCGSSAGNCGRIPAQQAREIGVSAQAARVLRILVGCLSPGSCEITASLACCGVEVSGGFRVAVSSFYTSMGFNVKIEHHNRVEMASFCSMVFDIHTFVVVPSPMKKILNIGWAHRKFHKSSPKVKLELLRGKAISLLAESRGSPILQSLALALVRLTEGSKVRLEDMWSKAKLVNANLVPLVVSSASRDVMEQAYGVGWGDQLLLEQYFDGLNCIGPLCSPILLSLCTDEQVHYFNHYVRRDQGKYPVFELPASNFDLPLREQNYASKDEIASSCRQARCGGT